MNTLITTRKETPCSSVSGVIYGMAFLGAATYYIQQATTFGEGALGLLKAIAWPALFIYRALGFWGM